MIKIEKTIEARGGRVFPGLPDESDAVTAK